MKKEIDKHINSIIENMKVSDRLKSAMLYSINAGGKRVRPEIALLVYKIRNREIDDKILRYASAIELIHTASLIHDDLPGIDNDNIRRHKATLHKAFDEATAILSGDLLFVKGLEILSENDKLKTMASLAVENLINGESIDTQFENCDISKGEWESMVKGKTGALIKLAFEVGSCLGGYNEEEINMLRQTGIDLGLVFQISDDLLDIIGNEKLVGKRLKKDRQYGKQTILKFHSLQEINNIIECYFKEIVDNLRNLDGNTLEIVNYIILLKDRKL
jgi:geranylgeranyl diphosphate synthase type II